MRVCQLSASLAPAPQLAGDDGDDGLLCTPCPQVFSQAHVICLGLGLPGAAPAPAKPQFKPLPRRPAPHAWVETRFDHTASTSDHAASTPDHAAGPNVIPASTDLPGPPASRRPQGRPRYSRSWRRHAKMVERHDRLRRLREALPRLWHEAEVWALYNDPAVVLVPLHYGLSVAITRLARATEAEFLRRARRLSAHREAVAEVGAWTWGKGAVTGSQLAPVWLDLCTRTEARWARGLLLPRYKASRPRRVR